MEAARHFGSANGETLYIHGYGARKDVWDYELWLYGADICYYYFMQAVLREVREGVAKEQAANVE